MSAKDGANVFGATGDLVGFLVVGFLVGGRDTDGLLVVGLRDLTGAFVKYAVGLALGATAREKVKLVHLVGGGVSGNFKERSRHESGIFLVLYLLQGLL